MPPRTQRANPGARSLVLAFVAVVGSFFASNLIVEQSSRAISDLAVRIIEDSSPSIEYLARVRKSVLEAELALLHFVSDPVGGRRHCPRSTMRCAMSTRTPVRTSPCRPMPVRTRCSSMFGRRGSTFPQPSRRRVAWQRQR
jgi:hypothetical protein